MIYREEQIHKPVTFFPLKKKKYIHLSPKEAEESIMPIIQEKYALDSQEFNESAVFRAKLGILGIIVEIKILPEGSISVLDFSFRYQNMFFLVSFILFAIVSLSIYYSSPIPIFIAVFIPYLFFIVNYKVNRFLTILNEVLPHVEQEYKRQILSNKRRRWKQEPKNIQYLYEKLSKKYEKIWGNTNILDYKISECKKSGLYYEETIRKIAEEEGIK